MIESMLTGSTGNIQKKTALWLDKLSMPSALGERELTFNLIVYRKSFYGWFIYVGDEPYWTEPLPEDLELVIRKAYEHECIWLMLDSANTPINGLPEYDW